MLCDYVDSYQSMFCEAEPVDPGPGPGAGPGPTCSNLPPLQCTGTNCSQLVPFDPDNGVGYVDYPVNGETWSNQYRSYIRRDLMMLIKYATAKVACKAQAWTPGNNEPLALIDMSEADGSIPGTSIGEPGHPDGTHTNGLDIDVAYYQTLSDNLPRVICEHTINGEDQYHCVSEPTTLDTWRSAAFLGFLFEHPSVRVVGADGKAGPPISAALTKLCQDGWLTTAACNSTNKLTYEVTNGGAGWYYFHHHHMHVSFKSVTYTSLTPTSASSLSCLISSCDTSALDSFLAPFGLSAPPVSQDLPRRRPLVP
ncbi:MAG: hypothetical protein CVU63_11570 [Deltaproteobacteria bacterium HGW-Deltaproteobacteria-20]|nr:MAG: hypothetical protein CVU63_11570 [Deltaproteobacteria bacterium HGW-Deltaproteobacteria-20]